MYVTVEQTRRQLTSVLKVKVIKKVDLHLKVNLDFPLLHEHRT